MQLPSSFELDDVAPSLGTVPLRVYFTTFVALSIMTVALIRFSVMKSAVRRSTRAGVPFALKIFRLPVLSQVYSGSEAQSLCCGSDRG